MPLLAAIEIYSRLHPPGTLSSHNFRPLTFHKTEGLATKDYQPTHPADVVLGVRQPRIRQLGATVLEQFQGGHLPCYGRHERSLRLSHRSGLHCATHPPSCPSRVRSEGISFLSNERGQRLRRLLGLFKAFPDKCHLGIRLLHQLEDVQDSVHQTMSPRDERKINR